MSNERQTALRTLEKIALILECAKDLFDPAFKACLDAGCTSPEIAKVTGVTKQAVVNRKRRSKVAE